MTGEIHPVSETLGALKTDVRYLRERADGHEAVGSAWSVFYHGGLRRCRVAAASILILNYIIEAH
ncbi:hypothetical protein [Bradyrhizobium zhanjiangense]|uniref:Uncharacterized protein n=1 Tax=Bradyrhizobium zhanjiangense TaxID=1325107 RepID=A0A4Q0QEC8_9BRAD|nr:hypothetical protein [Bradyrhizobium zhanjiangense]RXG89255.1 hypothetical protein EAS61_28265 [Bradyrhizobium zhanjiangense]